MIQKRHRQGHLGRESYVDYRTFGLGLQGWIDLDIPRKENRKCVMQEVVKVRGA